MAPAVAVDASPGRKEEDEEVVKKPSMVSFMCAFDEGADSDDDEEYVPLTEEYAQLVSDFKDKLDSTGGFDVPKIPFFLLDYVPARVQTTNPVAGQNDDDLIDVVNTAIRHHKKKNKMTDLVLVEILSSASQLCGSWQDYITFKARDSCGVVRTYETLINTMFSDDGVRLEIFRVKPYAPVECPGDSKVEKLLSSV